MTATFEPVWTHFDPDNAADDEPFWLWIDDHWQLATMWSVKDGDSLWVGLIEAGTHPASSDIEDAEEFRGVPCMPCNAPRFEPGEGDLLEVRVSLPKGASVAASYGTAEGAERAREAIMGVIASGTPA